jgi:uncharacterized protein (DUF3820 family)
MKKKIGYLIVMFCLYLNVQAQDERLEKNEKVESYRIAFITEKLNLSPKEATVFWPVYNEFSQKIQLIRKKERERVKQYKQLSVTSDSESEKFTNDYMLFKQQELDLTKQYLAEFKKVLPPAKVAKLVTLEQEFKLELLKRLKNKKE